VFPKIVVPQNGWFIVENPIKMDDLGRKNPIFGNTHIWIILKPANFPCTNPEAFRPFRLGELLRCCSPLCLEVSGLDELVEIA